MLRQEPRDNCNFQEPARGVLPTTGAEVMEQFREGMTERINQAIPYIRRGRRERTEE
jgi:hypothetical protein